MALNYANKVHNLSFKKVIESCGEVVKNESNEVLCEMQDFEGNTHEMFISMSLLKECGMIQEIQQIDAREELPKTQVELHTEAGDAAATICNLWKTSKNQTEDDRQATFVLLDLRKQFDKQFNDKKTAKNIMWAKIAARMNGLGYFVGEGIEGREKVRQKFANLQTSYQKYLQRRQQTGEGSIEKPQFFDDLDEILGGKHKMVPPFVIDSENRAGNIQTSNIKKGLKMVAATSEERNKDKAETCTSISTENTKSDKLNRFENIKTTVRPPKNRVVDVLKDMHRENMDQRKNEFNTIIDVIREENKQRHSELMAVIEGLNKKDNKRKRKRSNSDSD